MTDAPARVNLIVIEARLRHSVSMSLLRSSLVVLVFLSGCSPVTTFYRPGVSAARLEADSVQCEVSALKRVPVANKITQDPPRFIPSRTICDKNGNCRTIAAEFVPGEIRTIDANAPLRARVVRQCMAARGYSLEQIPQCTGSSAQSVQVSPLPTLTANSCAVRQGGRLGIGTQS